MLLALCTAVLIAGVVHPLSYLGVWLDWRPLRWIGLRSYSLYLWHWPVFKITRPQFDLPLDEGLPLLALRFGLTFLLADLSYRYVETPLRHGQLERLWQHWQATGGEARRKLKRRWLGAGISSPWCLVLLMALVEAKAPPPPDYLAAETPALAAGFPADTGAATVTALLKLLRPPRRPQPSLPPPRPRYHRA